MPARETIDSGRGVSRQAQSRSAGRRRQAARRRTAAWRWWVVGGVVGLTLIAGGEYYALAQQDSASALQPGSSIDGIACGAMEGQAEHIHVHLALYRNGKPIVVPAFVGIPFNQGIAGSACFYWLHTHATSGAVHVKAPAAGTYTLGQFFDIWRFTAQWDRQSTLDKTPRVDDAFPNALRAAPASGVRVYVGHAHTRARYRDLPLADHENITVELGAPLRPPVATFDWARWSAAGTG